MKLKISNSKLPAWFIVALILLAGLIFWLASVFLFSNYSSTMINSDADLSVETAVNSVGVNKFENSNNSSQTNSVVIDDVGWDNPMDKMSERLTKKPFGIFVSPDNSPVQPERFQGYHTAIDLETFEQEADVNVPIQAVCNGQIVLKRPASGYGGVLVQECDWQGNPVTVVYGHLDLSSILKNVGQQLLVGEFLGNLGQGYSSQTDGERKHLHLGIHRGSTVSLTGYVASENLLANWIDPCQILDCLVN